jgi:hypothetical protein
MLDAVFGDWKLGDDVGRSNSLIADVAIWLANVANSSRLLIVVGRSCCCLDREIRVALEKGSPINQE